MKDERRLTKVLALAGTVLVLLPLVAPFLLGLVVWLGDGVFRFDYLMPAELALFALTGGLLLIWAAMRERAQRRLIGWGFGVAVGLLVGSQALAVVTGLASGDTGPDSGWLLVVIAGLLGYALALVVVDVGGWLLLRDLFRGRGH